MSKLSGTVTSTLEEKWGLMANTVEADEPEVATSKEKPETAKPETAKPEKAEAAPVVLEKADPVKSGTGNVDVKVDVKNERVTKSSKRRTAGTKRRSSRAVFTIRRVAVGSLALIAVAAVVVAAILGWKLNEQNDIDSAADEARAAAEQYAVTLTSVSSDKLDENFAAVLDGATGEFKDMYSQSSGQLRDLLVENKANAQGTVIDAGIKSATTSKVEVLLFVDQSVTNTATPDARIDRSRVLMTMEKIDGRWLASKVDLP